MKYHSPYNIVTRDTFVSAAKAGQVPSDAVLRKQGVWDIEKAAADGADKLNAMQRRFCISTESVDRDNDVVQMNGWQTANYIKNPVVLWAHDYSQLPVGKCVKLGVEGGKLMATAEFADHDMARTVLRLIDGGFLNATSVGFRPMKYAINEERKGLDFSEQELLEFSIVPVPANPEALIAAEASGTDVALLKEWADGVLSALVDKGVSPSDCSMTKAPDDQAWSAPSLGDFSSKQWDDLTPAEKKNIAGHYAWADAAVPSSFGDCKLPHHEAKSGSVVWRGVAAAAARLNQTGVPASDMGAVKAHLARHYKQFGNTPPWDAQSNAWEAYLGKSVGKGDAELAALLDEAGFVREAAALRPAVEIKMAVPEPIDVKALVEEIAKLLKNNTGPTPSGNSALCPSCGAQMNAEPASGCDNPQAHEIRPGVPAPGIDDAPKTMKRGRVISAANEARLKACKEHLDYVLGQIKDMPDGDGNDDASGDNGKVADVETKADDINLDAVEGDIVEIDLKSEDMQETMRATLASIIRDITATETAKAISKARGRVD